VTLVLDGAERIAKARPSFLTELQGFAKREADAGKLRVVFESSGDLVLTSMMAQSGYSRALSPIEVGDVNDSDAVAYLTTTGVDRASAGGYPTRLLRRPVFGGVHPRPSSSSRSTFVLFLCPSLQTRS
jgi:hypothetical protein